MGQRSNYTLPFLRPHAVITGPPGSGKTSIIEKLSERVPCVPEPARRVLATARREGTNATGEKDPALFLDAMRVMMLNDLQLAEELGRPVAFDRSLPDLWAYSVWYSHFEKKQLPDHLSSASLLDLGLATMPNLRAFYCPVWEEIYTQDDERKMTLSDIRIFDELLRVSYERCLSFSLVTVPRGTPQERADFIAAAMAF